MFYPGLYSSFLLIKARAASKNLAFHFVEALAPYLFFMFKATEHVSNQTVRK